MARLYHCLVSAGGFTLHHRTGQPIERGVAVCAAPGLGLSCPLSAWRAEEIARWLEARRADLDGGSVHLGGWIDPRTDHVWLDLVTVVPEQLGPLAMALRERTRNEPCSIWAAADW